MDLFQDFKEGSSVLFCFFGGGVMLKRELVFIFTVPTWSLSHSESPQQTYTWHQ